MAKVLICWPPVKGAKGFPTATQNRQFQYFKDPTFIYPIIPATFATMLVHLRHGVLWLDAIAEQMDEVEFGRILIQAQPTHIIMEANTPLIKNYYEFINAIKENMPTVKIILTGEHVTALPEEVKKECSADYFIEGGKWYFEAFKIITGEEWYNDQRKNLPIIDRQLTKWWLYAYNNGNFKYIPATYIMAAQDCWHRPGCYFCSWANYHKECYTRDVEDVLTEVEHLINMGFKEIFDDSGTFPVGEWLKNFCTEMYKRGYHKYISFGCNMRFGSLDMEDYKLMAKAGFRMVLWGLESVNQNTLEMLNKCYNTENIKNDLILAKGAGLQSHLTCMFGYPWESYEDAKRTYDMVRWLLINDWAFSAQATICIPYPGTPLFNSCKENGLLKTEDWNRYDMTESIMKIPYSDKKLFDLQKGIYNTSYHPKFIWNKLKQIKSMDDLRYYFRLGKKIYNRFGQFYEISKVSLDY